MFPKQCLTTWPTLQRNSCLANIIVHSLASGANVRLHHLKSEGSIGNPMIKLYLQQPIYRLFFLQKLRSQSNPKWQEVFFFKNHSEFYCLHWIAILFASFLSATHVGIRTWAEDGQQRQFRKTNCRKSVFDWSYFAKRKTWHWKHQGTFIGFYHYRIQ